MKNRNNLIELKVPGLKDKKPSLIYGDSILV